MLNQFDHYIIDSWLYKCIKQKMGANKSIETVIDPTLYAQLVDQNKQCSIYRNKYGQQFEKYRIENFGVPEFQERYQYRIKSNQDHLVKAYYAGPIKDAFGCSSSNIYDVVIEKIQHRLSDLVNINSQESINIVNGSLKGFKQIYKSMGLILIKDSMIGINQQNYIKVWINSRFELNTIESQPLSYKNIPEHQRQNVMVVNIRSKKQPLWLRYCGQKQMLGVMSFEQAIKFTENFATSNGIRLRNFAVKPDFESDYTSKSILGQSRMMRSRSLAEKPLNKIQKGYQGLPMAHINLQKSKIGLPRAQAYNANIDPRVLNSPQRKQQIFMNAHNFSNPNFRPTFAHLRTRAINNNNNPNNKIDQSFNKNLMPNISSSLPLQGSFPNSQHHNQYQQNPNFSLNLNSNPHQALNNSIHRSIPQHFPPHSNPDPKTNTHFSYNMPQSFNPHPINTNNNVQFRSPPIQKSVSLQYINHTSANSANPNIFGSKEVSMNVDQNFNKNADFKTNTNFSTSIGSQIKKIIDIPSNSSAFEKKLTEHDSHIKHNKAIQEQIFNTPPIIKAGQIRQASPPQEVMIRQEINRTPSKKSIENDKLARSREPGKIKHKQKANEQETQPKDNQRNEGNQVNIIYEQKYAQPIPIVGANFEQQKLQQNKSQLIQNQKRENENQSQQVDMNVKRQQKVLAVQSKPQENTVANSLIKKQSEPIQDKPLIVISSQKNQKVNMKIEQKVKKIESFEQSKQEDESNMHNHSGWATQRFKNKYQHLQNRLSNSVRGASILMASDNKMQSSKISRPSSSDLKSSISYRDLRNLLRSVQRKQK